MKILHVYKDYHPVLGGIENHIRWQAEGMRARGHDVGVLVTNRTGRTVAETIGGVPVLKSARQLNVSSAPVSVQMAYHLGRLGRDADVVHLHAPYPPGELCQLLLGAGRHTVITYHSDIIKQATLLRFYAPFLRRILARADRILVSNPPYIRSSPFLRPIARRAPERLEVVHFGIDLERFAPSSGQDRRAAELRRRYGPGPLLLFVGRLRYYKGLDILLRAMAGLPDVRCLIAGSGPEAEHLRALAAELALAPRVSFLGDVPDADLPALYRAADLFVLPSVHRSESLGIVLLEAMASGLPLISTELGTGTSYVNVHGETGWVVPARDPDALAAAVGRLVENEEERRRMAAASRERARREFGLAQMVARTEAVYRSLG